VFTHAGGSNGYRNNITFVPEKKLGIVILTNQDNHNFHDALRFQLLDAYLNVPYTNRSQYYLARVQKSQKKSKL
jgi:CubicO group peptidase (beta-lactamase class C family)